ncbi:MAG: CDP-alcohol phosphatidyltransferase family protein, partial [Bacteroidota bacterium]
EMKHFITILNLLSGSTAIVLVFDHDLKFYASFLIFAAALFDFADGLFARLLKAYSSLGKELDSLSDMVSFGLAPALFMHHLIRNSLAGDASLYDYANASPLQILFLSLPLLIIAGTAIRLAKFNVDESQQDYFKGLPSPASGLFIAFVFLIYLLPGNDFYKSIIISPWLIIPVIVLLSWLMVSSFPMFNLKIKTLSIQENIYRYLLIIIALVLLFLFGYIAFPLVILLYIVLSVFSLATGHTVETSRDNNRDLSCNH